MSAKKVTCSLFGITLSRTKVSRARSAFLMSELFIVVGSSVEQDI